MYKWRYFLKLPVEAITLLLKNTRNSYKLELIRDCVLAKDISEVARKRIESNYKNYNPLNIREIYLRGSINKRK